MTLRPGRRTGTARAHAVRAALGAGVGAARRDRRRRATARADAASRAGSSRLRQIAPLTLIAAVLAMAAAMAGLLWQQRAGDRAPEARRPLDRRRCGARSLIESGVLFVTGCLLGALAALWGQLLFSRGLQTISGFPVEVDVRIGVAATAFAIVAGTAVVVVALPGYLVARVPPSLRPRD